MAKIPAQGLYDPKNEHDACGVGFVSHIKGEKRHSIIEQGLDILRNINHRGAVGADPLMGDGAGILIQIPDALYREELAKQGVTLPAAGEYGVGMIFLPQEEASRHACEQELERKVVAEGQVVLGWRDVPVNHDMPMSEQVKANEPVIRQIFIGRGPDVLVPDTLERKLYVIRKTASHAIRELKLKHGTEYFVPSMSARTIVYKGLLLSGQVGEYYFDLLDERAVSALAMVHQRFSTNTMPAWELAHPYRMVAHNGEINTVKGNVNWLNARTRAISSPVLGDDLEKLWPLVYPGQSDTASFDNCLELLTMAGYPLSHAMMMMIPEAWEQHEQMDHNLRSFYEYHASMMEPWDGPAAVCFTDGRQLGATLDRNGLRPARYIITDDDLVILASEAGTAPVAEEHIVKKWRLQPGKMLLIDMEVGRIIDDEELKAQLSKAKPYNQWIDYTRVRLDDLPKTPRETATADAATEALLDRQQAFGYTLEDLKFQLLPMGGNGQEAIGAMGNDAALPVLSDHCKPFYHYFRQQFAQVTNPAIDPIREQMVMSLTSFIGPKPNLLDINNTNPALRLEVSQPVLDFADMAKIRDIHSYSKGKFHSHELDITYPVEWGKDGIEAKLASLCAQAADAIAKGSNILIVSDRNVSRDRVAIPALLATSAIHQSLVEQGLRTSTGLVVDTGSAREVHHFALLGSFGAEAVHPWLALETLADQFADAPAGITPDKAVANFIKAVGKGLQKVMSKMGISTYMSYTSAQIFEAVGLNSDLINAYFSGTQSQIEGIGLFELADETLRTHIAAYSDDPVLADNLTDGGDYAWRTRGEEHLWTPDTIAKLQHATRSNNTETYSDYAKQINDQSRRHMTLRGLFKFRFDKTSAIPLEEVEPASEIVKRFATGAMSLGSISTEAHSTLAIAMNRIGGKSNTGEGGEDPDRYLEELKGNFIKEGDSVANILKRADIQRDFTLKEGDSLRSRIKQVASGRFGVTAAYLGSADQIQIKVAQGAKPGEGGHLPGHKVSPYIASLRFSVPGVGLISPPPHHDIYSIEDLAQLIYDLENANPRADVSVKLVAEVGVGTVAAGVAKAKADHVVIAGHDGGTGASPWSSIQHAGSPWELGLAETQQTLVLNGLRGRIRVQADGQMKTGRDIVIAALLGADEMGFATAPLVVEGCIMMRKCHLNTCPTGVATQDPVLRKRFTGQPEHVVNYFFFVAEEARRFMAKLGIRNFDDLIGRADLLDTRDGIDHWKAKGLDFSRVFHLPDAPADVARHHCELQDHELEKALDRKLIDQAQPALENGKKVSIETEIRNLNRTAGAQLSSEVARLYGHGGLPADTIHVALKGVAGQSFGAFLANGVTFDLEGESNDYVGKSLSGGRLIVRVPADFHGDSAHNIIAGNTVLYGATEGEAYFNGVAGERFAVRNSGAATVVEGVGDHGCEYMTGGTVVVLGDTGRNFAAGMSGGVAYVYDPDGKFAANCNPTSVDLTQVDTSKEQQAREPADHWHSLSRKTQPNTDEAILKQLIEQHLAYTGSQRARTLLDGWDNSRQQFVKVMPHEYQRALKELAEANNTTTEKVSA